MSIQFDPSGGLVVVMARIFGPKGQRAIRLAVDTGATMTTVRTATLVRLGYDPAASEQRVSMATASGVEYVPRVAVDRIEVLGQERSELPGRSAYLAPLRYGGWAPRAGFLPRDQSYD